MKFIYRYISTYERSPRWMAFSHYKAEYDQCLYVIYPFNFLVAFTWWLQYRWAKHTKNPSWIEKEVRSRVKSHPAIIKRDQFIKHAHAKLANDAQERMLSTFFPLSKDK